MLFNLCDKVTFRVPMSCRQAAELLSEKVVPGDYEDFSLKYIKAKTLIGKVDCEGFRIVRYALLNSRVNPIITGTFKEAGDETEVEMTLQPPRFYYYLNIISFVTVSIILLILLKLKPLAFVLIALGYFTLLMQYKPYSVKSIKAIKEIFGITE